MTKTTSRVFVAADAHIPATALVLLHLSLHWQVLRGLGLPKSVHPHRRVHGDRGHTRHLLLGVGSICVGVRDAAEDNGRAASEDFAREEDLRM